MRNWGKVARTWGVWSALVVAVSASSIGLMNPNSSQVQAKNQPGPLAQPNMILNIQRQSGSCPSRVGLWTFLLPYEGGADHTAVADTVAIASQPPNIVKSGPKFVEYQAPLRQNYASCVGKAISQTPAVYNFQFGNGKVTFSVDVSKLSVPYTKVASQSIVAFRPYVRWAVAD